MSRAGLFAVCAAVCAAAASLVAWQTETTIGASGSAGPFDGAELFQGKGCATCHDGPDSSAAMFGFPSLVGAPDWAAERRPGLSADEYLAESMRTPSVFISPAFGSTVGPTDAMPDLGLTEAEIAALVGYLLQG